MENRRRVIGLVIGVVVVLVAGTAGVVWVRAKPKNPAVVVQYTGPTTSTPPETTTPIPQPPPPAGGGRPAVVQPGPPVGIKVANGTPHRPAIPFKSSIAVPNELQFVLVLGSDARPNEDLLKTRADSIHLVAVNPASGQGTIVGIPRDAYVQFPSGGRGKINDALARGGPKYVAETVRQLSGLPVHYVALTGFVGLQKMVDDLGGLDAHVPYRMNDKNSGARFEPGWHHFVGGEALAFTRNRGDVPNGDFSRSENHGLLMLAALSKLRSEVADDPGLLHWVGIMRKYCWLDVPADHMPRLAALARRIEPEKMANLVLPGRIGYAGRASVVYLSQDAPRVFDDLRDDAVIGTAAPPTTTTTEAPPTTGAPPTTTTTSPTAAATTSTTVQPSIPLP